MERDINAGVKKCLSEVLAIPADGISDEARIVEDLGAESLDLVELMFLLEQEFDIRLNKSDMSLSAQLGLEEDAIHRNEILTPLALERLREKYPHATHLLVDGMSRNSLMSLFTVHEVVLTVQRKLA